MAKALNFWNTHTEQLTKAMYKVAATFKTNNIMLNIIDIVDGRNIMYCPSECQLKNILEKSFNVNFKQGLAQTENIIMRKQIVKAIESSAQNSTKEPNQNIKV